MFSGLFVLLGITFGSLAALMAFLITYNEYRKHKLELRRLWKEALSSAALAFVVFFVVAVVFGSWVSSSTGG